MKKQNDETLSTLVNRVSAPKFHHGSLDEYLAFPRYEQYNENVYEDILYTKSQVPDSQGSRLMVVDLVSGGTQSQNHKLNISLRGEYCGKPLNPIAYQERFPWENSRSPITRNPITETGETLTRDLEDTSDHIDFLLQNTQGVWDGAQPFGLDDVGELGDDFNQMAPSTQRQQIAMNNIISQQSPSERLSSVFAGTREQIYAQSEALKREWKGKGITLAGITRPVDMPSVPHSNLHNFAAYQANDTPSPATASNSAASANPPSLSQFDVSDLYRYESPPVSPRILPSALQQRPTPPPSPPPMYYNPARYQDSVPSPENTCSKKFPSRNSRAVAGTGNRESVGADLSCGAGAGEEVICRDGSVARIPELRRIWELSYFSGCDYNEEKREEEIPLSFPIPSGKHNGKKQSNKPETSDEEAELTLLLSSLCFDEDKYATQKKLGRSLAQNKQCRPLPGDPHSTATDGAVQVLDRRPRRCTCGANAYCNANVNTNANKNTNAAVSGNRYNSQSTSQDGQGGEVKIDVGTNTPIGDLSWVWKSTSGNSSIPKSPYISGEMEAERWAAAKEGGYGAGTDNFGMGNHPGEISSPMICVCASMDQLRGRECTCECSDATLCQCVPDGNADFYEFQRKTLEMQGKWADLEPVRSSHESSSISSAAFILMCNFSHH